MESVTLEHGGQSVTLTGEQFERLVDPDTGEIVESQQEGLPGFEVPEPETGLFRVQLTIVRAREVFAQGPEEAIRRFVELDNDGQTVTIKRSLAATKK